MKFRRTLLASMSGLLALSTTVGAQTFSTGPADSWLAFLGVPGNGTIGQVFVAPAANLTSFSFYVGGYSSQAFSSIPMDALSGVSFTAHLRAFDGEATGPDLWTSSVITMQPGFEYQPYDEDTQLIINPADFTQYTLNTGGTILSPSSAYIMYLEAVDDGIHMSNVAIGWASESPDLPGNVMFFGNYDRSGDAYLFNGQMAYDATFEAAVAPEPASLVLVATGLLGVVVAARRRRTA